HQIFPTVMIVLCAVILFVTARGTRQLLLVSISERMARHRLSRFFAPDIASRLTAHSGDDGARGAVQPVAVLFTDIREFSPLAEELSPGELTEFLGEFREIVAQQIQEHGGVVDKFIGDAAMAVFGFPAPGADSASRCLSCAYAMMEHIEAWSETRIANRQQAVRIGIGIHYGEAFVGVVGKERLLEFTVIGDTVNIAERVERLTRTFNADIAVSRDFADAAGLDPVPSGWRSAPAQPISGHSRPVDIFYLQRVGDRVGSP
ncbi:MAG: adenylate cyclase, partial [Alphaproteobacteria bacterium]